MKKLFWPFVCGLVLIITAQMVRIWFGTTGIVVFVIVIALLAAIVFWLFKWAKRRLTCSIDEWVEAYTHSSEQEKRHLVSQLDEEMREEITKRTGQKFW